MAQRVGGWVDPPVFITWSLILHLVFLWPPFWPTHISGEWLWGKRIGMSGEKHTGKSFLDWCGQTLRFVWGIFLFSFWLSFAFVFFYLYYCMPFPAGTKFGKLVLVDLAGYERFAATGITTVGSLALLVLVWPPQINWRGFWGETSKQCSLGVIKWTYNRNRYCCGRGEEDYPALISCYAAGFKWLFGEIVKGNGKQWYLPDMNTTTLRFYWAQWIYGSPYS